MDELTDDLDQEVEETEETPEVAPQERTVEYYQKQAEKARREAQQLRGRLRRSELTAQHGAEVVELIPESLSLKEQDALAIKLAERFAATNTAETEQATEEAPVAEPTPQEQRLAAVGTGPSAAGTARPSSDMTNKQILDLGKSDPARALQEIKARSRTP